MKIAILLIIVGLGILWWSHQKKLKQAARSRRKAEPRKLAPEAMLRCHACGVHLPASEALISDDGQKVWCSAEHRSRDAA